MAKELPYFQFFCAEWLNDDISISSYKCKGVFADICAWYWFKDCSITKAQLEQRFSKASKEIQYLFDNELVKSFSGDFIEITFLDNQYDMLSERRQKKQQAGAKGGKQKSSNAKAKLKHTSSTPLAIKKRKEVEKKRIDKIPTCEDFLTFAKTTEIYHNSMDTQIRMKYESWVVNDWHDGNNKPIKNWKTKLLNCMPHFKTDEKVKANYTYKEVQEIHFNQKDKRTMDNFEVKNGLWHEK